MWIPKGCREGTKCLEALVIGHCVLSEFGAGNIPFGRAACAHNC